jgi:iron complex transport system substrate-binding protein
MADPPRLNLRLQSWKNSSNEPDMKKSSLLLLFVIAFLFVKPYQISAANVTPKRIVSLSPNLTEIVFALGLGDRVVAVSSDCDWPAEAKTKPNVGSFWQPNTEVILTFKPDLVICETFPQQKEVAETLRRTGINVLPLKVESIDELFTAIDKIGQAADCQNAADKLAKDINDGLEQIRIRASSAEKVRVLWVISNEPVRVAGVKTFINEIVELAGGQNAIAQTPDLYPVIGTEEVLLCGAEVIIQSAMGKQDVEKQQADAEQFWIKFPNLPAVKNRKIYVIDPDTVFRLGPRLPRGVRTVAECLHPELFIKLQDKNTVAKTDD